MPKAQSICLATPMLHPPEPLSLTSVLPKSYNSYVTVIPSHMILVKKNYVLRDLTEKNNI